jgi:hypothetical protein
MKKRVLLPPLLFSLPALACLAGQPAATAIPTPRSRLESIPPSAVKGTPEGDFWPPVIAAGWSRPEPLGAPINTAGGEDSPFVTPDGQTLYFFFTPDVNIPTQQSFQDGVTGIWESHRVAECTSARSGPAIIARSTSTRQL